jgi:antitoxin component YwqK of YwqJK toxin-antitoxin module
MSCEPPTVDHDETASDTKVSNDSIRDNIVNDSNEKINPKRINYTDENGLKQGRWEEIGWKNRVVGMQTYVNDTLHGPWLSTHGITTSGFYENGKKQGYERQYYHNDADSNTLAVGYYVDDIGLWFSHPTADHGLLKPVKGMNVQVDSVYVKAPFHDGSLWYEGLFLRDEAIGIHKVYYPNGELQGLVDYGEASFVEYDSLGNLLRQGHLRTLTYKKRFGVGSNYKG